jgi:hypothetical protein
MYHSRGWKGVRVNLSVSDPKDNIPKNIKIYNMCGEVVFSHEGCNLILLVALDCMESFKTG